jgi:hypothetical protein
MESLSGLPARRPVRLATRSRSDLEAYLTQELGRQLPPERVRAIVRAYARFGLVPDSLDLEPLLRSLFLEQVVGYYDPRTDTLYVVEGVGASQVEAVLAHEIVHALQDQYQDLDSLMEATRDTNDRGTAARAALEGHATFAMLEWQLEQVTGTDVDLTSMLGLGKVLANDPLAAAGLEMPVLRDAPAVIRESLLFPYLGGLAFLQVHWGGPGGRTPPLGAEMPVSTEQVLHPERFARESRDTPVEVRFPVPLPYDWSVAFSDGLGELETRIFLREFLADRERADRAAEGWDGDRYRVLDGPVGEVLVWVSVWDGASDADEFAAAAVEAFARRYSDSGSTGEKPARSVSVERRQVGGRAAVVVRDTPAVPGAHVPPAVAEFALEEFDAG